MILVYNKEKSTFTAYSDVKAVSSLTGIRADLLREFYGLIKVGEFIIGNLEIVKSNRGGNRGNNNLKK